jgi:cation:H+ antiporter
MEFIYIIAGLVLLIFGGDYLVKGASGIAIKLNITPMLVGMTVVAMGTSAPELVVSLGAALAGKSDIAVGNVVGSNIANVAFILGLTVLIFPLVVKKDSLRFDWLAMILATILFYFTGLDGEYSRINGIIFVILLVAFLTYSVVKVRKSARSEKVEIPEGAKNHHFLVLIAFVIFGSAALVFGAKWFLEGAEYIARYFGVTDRVIALTLVAFGTSVPELAASVMAAFKKEQDISLGNIIGSNLFNILFIIGLTSVIKPINVDSAMLESDYIWMIGTSFAILPLAIWKMRLSRFAGVLLVLTYALYVFLLVSQTA